MSTKLKTIVNELECELERVLDYWSDHSIDFAHGGFVGEIDRLGSAREQASKGAVLNTRILWTYSAAYNHTQNSKYLDLANKAYDYLIKYFWDSKYGGLVWKVDYLGKPKNKRKQAYAQGFGVYALSEYYRASKNEKALQFAVKLYELIEEKFRDNVHGGYIEALDYDWSALSDMRLSKKDINEPKSMNTHLHIIEPYTNLYRVWPDEKLKKNIKELLDLFLDKIINPETGHFNLFFDMRWNVKSSIVSYGHDIEGAWLLTDAARVFGDKQLIEKIEKAALNLADITLQSGVDKDGGLFHEKYEDHLDDDKHWWPQAEAMVGFMDAFSISGNEKYFTAILKSWDFIKTYIIDNEYGEWHWRVNKEGLPQTTDYKVGFWKCPYHNSRALIEMVQRLK